MTATNRRGFCPSLAAPMPTGDGLLVRLNTNGTTVGLESFAGLCAAARAHGNGIVEVTARGSLQIRGLTSASAQIFAEVVTALGLDRGNGVPVMTDPLAGFDPAQPFDAGGLAKKLRDEIAAASFAASLGPKVSVIIDGGGTLHLDALHADIRLRAHAVGDVSKFQVALGGGTLSAQPLAMIDPRQSAAFVLRLLEVLASRGPQARARDVIRDAGLGPFEAAVNDLRFDAPQILPPRAPSEPIGAHRLHDGNLALGIGLAFGHVHIDAMDDLIAAAAQAGAHGVRTAPGRALLFLGVPPENSPAVTAVAERCGFIVRADDPRRHIVACAGSPVCAAAEIPTRELAPALTRAAAPLLDGSVKIHLSGCAKGCAYQGPATLTFIGKPDGCGVVVNGSARDSALAPVPPDTLPAGMARLAGEVERVRHAGECAADVITRLGAARIVAILEEAAHG